MVMLMHSIGYRVEAEALDQSPMLKCNSCVNENVPSDSSSAYPTGETGPTLLAGGRNSTH